MNNSMKKKLLAIRATRKVSKDVAPSLEKELRTAFLSRDFGFFIGDVEGKEVLLEIISTLGNSPINLAVHNIQPCRDKVLCEQTLGALVSALDSLSLTNALFILSTREYLSFRMNVQAFPSTMVIKDGENSCFKFFVSEIRT